MGDFLNTIVINTIEDKENDMFVLGIIVLTGIVIFLLLMELFCIYEFFPNRGITPFVKHTSVPSLIVGLFVLYAMLNHSVHMSYVILVGFIAFLITDIFFLFYKLTVWEAWVERYLKSIDYHIPLKKDLYRSYLFNFSDYILKHCFYNRAIRVLCGINFDTIVRLPNGDIEKNFRMLRISLVTVREDYKNVK